MPSSAAFSSSAIARIISELSCAPSAHDRTAAVIAALREAVDVPVAVVYQRRFVSGEVPMVYSCGISSQLEQHMTDRSFDPERVAGLESFVNVLAVARRPRLFSLEGSVYQREDGLVWSAAFPVFSGADVVGALLLAWRETVELTPGQMELCETAGALIGAALQQDALVERTSELAALRERTRLARDIHDSATQAITATVLNIEAADRALGDDPAAARQALLAAKQLARECLVDLRRSIWNLRSDLLRGKSFQEALEGLVEPLREAGINCAVDVHGATAAVPAETSEAALSIAREALSNVWRHSGASVAEVRLLATSESVLLTITDDGAGMSQTISETSFGILGMEERANSVGGSVRLSSHAGHGTRVEAYLPFGVSEDSHG